MEQLNDQNNGVLRSNCIRVGLSVFIDTHKKKFLETDNIPLILLSFEPRFANLYETIVTSSKVLIPNQKQLILKKDITIENTTQMFRLLIQLCDELNYISKNLRKKFHFTFKNIELDQFQLIAHPLN